MTGKTDPFRKFQHFHFHEVSHLIPSVTLMVEQSEDDPKVWFVSWAVCNPTDQFSRQVGRQIAVDSWENRGYTIVLDNEWEDPLNAAVTFLVTSKATKRDKEVQRVREALYNYITEEEIEALSGYYRILSLAYEKTGVVMKAIENISNVMAK